MSSSSVTHASFTLARSYAATPAQVFAAFADPTLKARWFAGPPDWEQEDGIFEFRVGGRETNRGGPKGGPVHAFAATYYDIVPNERIVYAYEMHMDATRISVSLATIEFAPEEAGTRLTLTEHGAFLDGHDSPALREEGTTYLLDALGGALTQQPTTV